MTPESRSSQPSIRRKLGRGLGSLISAPVRIDLPPPTIDVPGTLTPATASQSSQSSAPDAEHHAVISMIELHLIHPNPRQPRQHFDEDSLRSLAASIKTSGVMQPIVVRTQSKPGSAAGSAEGSNRWGCADAFQIIAGERRWRAAQIAGLKHIPAIVRDVDDKTAAEFSLVENIQREDLNPIERAEAFQRLIDEFNFTHNQIAERVGIDRSSVTNHLRLNELDDEIKDGMRAGRLSIGHAKILLGVTNIERRAALAGLAVRNAWSVRELERQIAEARLAGDAISRQGPVSPALSAPVPAHMVDLQKRLSQHLGTKVFIRPGRNKGSGKLVIEFYTLDQFEGLMRQIGFNDE